MPNAGLRLEAGGRVLANTGDTGPSAAIVELARAADLFLAEASFAEHAARRAWDGELGVARGGVVVELGS